MDSAWSVVASVATAVAVALATVTFLIDSRRREREREEQAFETVTTHYMSFLQLAMQNPDLTLAQLETDRLAKSTSQLGRRDSEDYARRDAILFEYFFQVLEKVFILYRAADLYTTGNRLHERVLEERVSNEGWRTELMSSGTSFRTRQWLGWDAWIQSYCEAEVIRDYWSALDNDETYDTYFMEYMKCRIRIAKGAAGGYD